jgi:HK97 family phage portal protein
VFWRCVALMSTVVAGCPLRAYRLDKDQNREEVFPDLFSKNNPNMRYTQYELWSLVVAHLMTWGNAYILKYRDPTVGRNKNAPPQMRQVTDLRPIDPARVEVKLDKKTREKIFLVTRVDADGNSIPDAPPLVLTTYEVMHIPGLGYNGVVGLSPVDNFRRTLGTSIAADKLAARFYGKGTLLSGFIKVTAPLKNQEQADKIRERWIQKSGGVAHGAEVAVLDADSEFIPLTIPPASLQFLESRRWQTTEVARMFGIPPHLVGDVEKSTSWGTGIEEQNTGFVNYTVSDYTNRMEQRATRELLTVSTQFCEFDLDRLLRGSQAERYAAYNVGINSGWLLRNEARRAENKAPIAGLDDALVPLNMQTVKQAAAAAKAGLKAQSAPPMQPPVSTSNDNDQDPDDNDNRSLPLEERRDTASKVFMQQAEDYPVSAMAWMHHAEWKGPVEVPLSHIQPDMKWLDKAVPDHVQDFVKRLKKGKKVKPLILVKEPGKTKLQLVDGHHRYLAYKQLNIPAVAFIGTVDSDHGAWETMHDHQIDNKRK